MGWEEGRRLAAMTIIRDRQMEAELQAARKASGADRYDEVWEGVTVMSPLADYEHQEIATNLTILLGVVITWERLGTVLAGTNISDGREDWTKNYRCPHVVVILNETTAAIRGTHLVGGPDLAIEVASPDDATREKIPFYAQVGTRELLIVDRDPWAIELLRLENGQLVSMGRSTAEDSHVLESAVVPLTFRLEPGEPRPRLVVDQPASGRSWVI
jgi:Uma2 family endonuclease